MPAANHPSNGTFRVKRKVEGLPSGTVNLTCFVRLSPYFTDVRNVSPVTRFLGTETSNESLEVFSGDDNDDSAEAFRFPPGLLLLLLDLGLSGWYRISVCSFIRLLLLDISSSAY